MKRRLIAALVLCLLTSLPASAWRWPFVNSLFSENMVLQRDKPVPIWGVGKPGSNVTVSVTGLTRLPPGAVTNVTVKSDAQGNWRATVGPFPAGGPCTVVVSGWKEDRATNVTYALTNVLVGDVWLCSGQSNMKFALRESQDGQAAAAGASPQLRLMTVPEVAAAVPQAAAGGGWSVCTPDNAAGFSAAAYYFGAYLHTNLSVPIGLVNSSWGGTRIQAWMSLDSQRAIPECGGDVGRLDALVNKIRAGRTVEQVVADWYAANDAGSASEGASWAAPDLDTAAWRVLPGMPKRWSDSWLTPPGGHRGVVWYRKTVTIPDDWAGRELHLKLCRITEANAAFYDGVCVGSGESVWQNADYVVPAGLVKAGQAVIAVRNYGTGGDSGFRPELSSDFKLDVGGTTNSISLAGDWLFRTNATACKAEYTRKPDNNTASADFNGMIAPLVPMAIKGAVWYQGEWNTGEGRLYNRLLPVMIQDWRTRFKQGDFPFLIVQLASLDPTQPPAAPDGSGWAEVREAEWLVSDKAPNCGLGTAVDTHGLHPLNKAVLGERLGRAALARVYGKKVAHLGPTFESMKKSGDGIEVKFKNVAGELLARGELKAFSLAGADRKFVWAKAAIKGKDTVAVSSPEVKDPTIVRYGWADSPECTLYDKAGLPALPFRSDLPTDLPPSPYDKPAGK